MRTSPSAAGSCWEGDMLVVDRWGVGAAVTMTVAVTVAFGTVPVADAATSVHGRHHATAEREARAAAGNPYSPEYHHPYRLGAVPTRGRARRMAGWASGHRRAGAQVTRDSSAEVTYHGGIDGIGVTTGAERVYLVFYGSQWGTAGTNGAGDTTLTGDPSGAAPYLQEFFNGLGTGSELWSGVMTQYCDGVASGAASCPGSSTEHVGYPTGGALAGVWVDESTASPSQATGHQLGVEAVAAAAHFGNTTAAANRDAQYVVLSPTGTHPDGFNTPSGGFCAWHDYNGDSGLSGGAVSSPYGDIAFTNMPYVTDMGVECGQGFVNSPGTLDGVSIVEGHEYAETVTDQNPGGGWWDSSGNEVGDKCAWITPGSSGGSFDLTTATGSYAVQTIWGNDGNSGAGACEAAHAIVTNGGGGNTVTVTNPGSQTGTVGTAASLQIHASDSASGQTLTYGATGLPAGLSISPSTGLISGTPTTATTYSVTVRVTDTTTAAGTASFSWAIAASGSPNAITNGTFETGALAPWTCGGATCTVTATNPHSGSYAALTGSATWATRGSSAIAQTFTAVSGSSHVSFWYDVRCPGSVSREYATATLRDNTRGLTTRVLAHTCNNRNVWVQVTVPITAGHSYTLALISHDDNRAADPTAAEWDDIVTS